MSRITNSRTYAEVAVDRVHEVAVLGARRRRASTRAARVRARAPGSTSSCRFEIVVLRRPRRAVVRRDRLDDRRAGLRHCGRGGGADDAGSRVDRRAIARERGRRRVALDEDLERLVDARREPALRRAPARPVDRVAAAGQVLRLRLARVELQPGTSSAATIASPIAAAEPRACDDEAAPTGPRSRLASSFPRRCASASRARC